jgi:hypothetical protein
VSPSEDFACRDFLAGRRKDNAQAKEHPWTGWTGFTGWRLRIIPSILLILSKKHFVPSLAVSLPALSLSKVSNPPAVSLSNGAVVVPHLPAPRPLHLAK